MSECRWKYLKMIGYVTECEHVPLDSPPLNYAFCPFCGKDLIVEKPSGEAEKYNG